MDKKKIKKEYKTEEITIVWEASKCIHSGNCVRGQPKVFNHKARPWIEVDKATKDELIDQIDKCPSGAISYIINES